MPQIAERSPRSPGTVPRLLIPLVLAALFLCLCSYKIGYIGSYADELHQAVHSLCYVCQDSELCSGATSIGGVRLMNMSYIGACKSHLYGVYLKLSGTDFDLVQWRMMGVVLGSAFLLGFLLLLRNCLNRSTLLLLGLLCVLDGTVLLSTRHDWGPTVLSLGLRCLLLAFWIRGVVLERPGPNALGASAMTLLAIFEKLSNVVLMAPLGLCLLQFRAWRRAVAPRVILGAALGAIPLILVNLIYFLNSGSLVSLSVILNGGHSGKVASPGLIFGQTLQYLSLGTGLDVGGWILGDGLDRFFLGLSLDWLERSCMLVLLILGLVLILRTRHHTPLMRTALACFVSYVAIWVLLWLLPRQTWAHHWIIGTPFQYAGLALVFQETATPGMAPRWLRQAFLALLVLLLALRVVSVGHIEWAIHNEEARRPEWSTELHRLGDFAREHAQDGPFIATDWGVRETIRCASTNRARAYEFLFNYRRKEQLVEVVSSFSSDRFYVVGLIPGTAGFRDVSKRIRADLETLEGWARVEDPDPALKDCYILEYVRKP